MENWGSARRQTLPGLLLLHCRFPGGVGPSSCSTYVWVSAAPLDRRRILPAGGGEAVLHKRCISSRINQEGRCRTPCVSVCGVSRWLLGDGGHPAVTHTHTHRCSACLPANALHVSVCKATSNTGHRPSTGPRWGRANEAFTAAAVDNDSGRKMSMIFLKIITLTDNICHVDIDL